MVSRRLNVREAQSIELKILRLVDEACANRGINYCIVCGSVLGAVRHGGAIPWDPDTDITVPLPEMDAFCDAMEDRLCDTPFCIHIPGKYDHPGNVATFPRIAPRGIDPRLLHVDVFPQIGISSSSEEQVKHTERLTRIKTKYRDKCIALIPPDSSLSSKAKQMIRRAVTRHDDRDALLKEFYELCAKYNYYDSEFVTNPCGHYGTKNIVPKTMFGTLKRIPYEDMLLPVPQKTEEYLRHYYGDYLKYPPQKVIAEGMNYSITIEGDFNEQAI